VPIDPRFVPVFKASLRDREALERARKARAAATETIHPASVTDPVVEPASPPVPSAPSTEPA